MDIQKKQNNGNFKTAAIGRQKKPGSGKRGSRRPAEAVHLCTIFDSNYLDKGLALYESLEKNCRRFWLYIFAFDDIAYGILNRLSLPHAKIISLQEFETPQLAACREKRSKGEYCWTCTPAAVEYVLDHFQVPVCTYIDSDLYFYSSPQVLLQEFENSNCSVGLVKHGFPDTAHGRQSEKRSGKYCVEFNTFRNDAPGRQLLTLWKNLCLEECSIETGGDQYYLTDWGSKYPQVYEYQNAGAGVAPWNLMKYKLEKGDGRIKVAYKKKRYQLVFYHFQGIQYSDGGYVNIKLVAVPDGSLIGRGTVRMLYYPYLAHIEAIRQQLKTAYGLDVYQDGCSRTFEVVLFRLLPFLKAVARKAVQESLWSSLDLIIRVCRKRDDIIKLCSIKGEGQL